MSKETSLRGFLRTPKGYLTLILLGIMLFASLLSGSWDGWLNAGVAVTAAVVEDVAFALAEEQKRIFPDGAVLTGLIIAMVLGGSETWLVTTLTAGAAILSKHVLVVKRKPVFNPAAVGLLLSILLFGSGQSWWGGLSLLPAYWIPVLLVAGMLVAKRVNKLPLVFAYLGTFFGLLLLLAFFHAPNVADGLRMPVTNSVLFLAFFMLTDPPTSPARLPEQILFGAIAATIAVADFVAFYGLSFLLYGLLAANGWNAWRLWTAARAKTAAVCA